MINIAGRISIREDELVFRFCRSAGPGGQNVNKVNTSVTVYFDLAASEAFSEYQKKKIQRKFASRINKAGTMWVVCQRHRTQKANRQGAVERLVELLAQGIAEKKPRRKTKVSYAATQQRLDEKKRRGRLKKQRSDKAFED